MTDAARRHPGRVWVPASWAGAVAMDSEERWRGLVRELSARAGAHRAPRRGRAADALVIGTELGMTSKRPEWLDLIASARAGYSRTLLYVSHNADEAEAAPFWDRLDAVAVSLYPPLGDDDDRAGRQLAMRAVGDRLDALARTGKSIVVGGERPSLRARGGHQALGKRRGTRAAADPSLQAAVLADWLSALDSADHAGRHDLGLVHGSGCRRPGGHRQHRAGQAERLLMCAWTAACAKP
jgi:Glycoside Hydrolase Family 113